MADLTQEAIEAGELELSRVLKDFDYLMPADGMARVLTAALSAAPSPTLPSREEVLAELVRGKCQTCDTPAAGNGGGSTDCDCGRPTWTPRTDEERASAVLALFSAPQPFR